jgi:hypothetical protein
MLTEAQAAQIEKIRAARVQATIAAKEEKKQTPKPVTGIGACHRCGKPTVGRLCKRCKDSEPKPEPKAKVETVGPVNVTVSKKEPKTTVFPEQLARGLKKLLGKETEVCWDGKKHMTNGHWLLHIDDEQLLKSIGNVKLGNKGVLRFDGKPKAIGTRFGGDEAWGDIDDERPLPEFDRVIPKAIDNLPGAKFKTERGMLMVLRDATGRDTVIAESRRVSKGDNGVRGLNYEYANAMATMVGIELAHFPSTGLKFDFLEEFSPVLFCFAPGVFGIVMPVRL